MKSLGERWIDRRTTDAHGDNHRGSFALSEADNTSALDRQSLIARPVLQQKPAKFAVELSQGRAFVTSSFAGALPERDQARLGAEL
jgi:hypothetical protein